MLTDPDPALVAEGRCGRWRNGTEQRRAGGRTPKEEALARLAAGESAEALREEYREQGARCRAKTSPAGSACRLHGGATPSGPESPHWRHGGHSVAHRLPRELLAAYEETLNDPARFAFVRQVAGYDALLAAVFPRIEGTPPIETLRDVLDDFERAFSPDVDPAEQQRRIVSGMRALRRLVETELESAEARAEAREILNAQRLAVAAEHLRRHREEVQVSMSTVAATMARLAEVTWGEFLNGSRELDDETRATVRGLMQKVLLRWREEEQRWTLPSRGEVEVN